MLDVVVAGTGRYLPGEPIPNADLVAELKKLDPTTNGEWIVERTGVHQRHRAAPDESTSDMALKASLNCLNSSVVDDPNEIDLIVVPTVSGDTTFPATANWLQGKLENTRAWSFDVNAGCSGFVYGLAMVTSLIRSGQSNLALLVGSEKMSELYNPTDRTSYPLAGDGAAAVLLWGVERSTDRGIDRPGIHDFYLQSDGQMADLLVRPLGGTSQPLTPENILDPGRFLQMDGKAVYKHAVRRMSESIIEVLRKVKVELSAVDWFIGHQANRRILQAVADKVGVPREKVYSNIEMYANTTSATIPLCLDDLAKSGQLKPGHKVVLFTFGTGFTWGACYLVWGRS